MSDYDGLRLCRICGDRETQQHVCSSCRHQEDIDNYEMWEPASPCMICGVLWVVSSNKEVVKECPDCYKKRMANDVG